MSQQPATTGPEMPSATRPVRAELAALLRSLRPGQKIRIRQKVRINCRRAWDTADIVGTFRGVNFLATGLATDRVRAGRHRCRDRSLHQGERRVVQRGTRRQQPHRKNLDEGSDA